MSRQTFLIFVQWATTTLSIILIVVVPDDSWSAVIEDQVLVLFNSQGPDTNDSGNSDSQDVFDHYRMRRPNVLGFDFNDSTLHPGNISYSDYRSKIRDPLRSFLATNHLEQQTVVFTLTRGLPHRIQDSDSPMIGDSPGGATNEFLSDDVTYASVDSELPLLWHSLDTNETGGAMDSHSDNVIYNPYHGKFSAITSFDRSDITSARAFQRLHGTHDAWRMKDIVLGGRNTDAGNVYLTARLDGNSVKDVREMIDRGFYVSYNSLDDTIVIDENAMGILDNEKLFLGNLGYLGDDYDDTEKLLSQTYSSIEFNQGNEFLIGSGPGFTGAPTVNTQVVHDNVAAFISYGGNHESVSNEGFLDTFSGQLVAGAIMNTLESYNGKSFGGQDGFFDQGQLSQWIAIGGTFGIGNVWEPFAFSLPDNEALLDSFLLRGRTWVEAAWSSIPWLSWQQTVLGDPLATAIVIDDPQEIVWTGSDGSGVPGDGIHWSDQNNWIRAGDVDQEFRHGDTVILGQGSAQMGIELTEHRIVESMTIEAPYRLSGSPLVLRSGNLTINDAVEAAIDSDVFANSGLVKKGGGTLLLNGVAPRVKVETGMLGGTGHMRSIEVLDQAVFSPGESVGTITITEELTLDDGATLQIEIGGLLSGTEYDFVAVQGHAQLDGTIDVNTIGAYNPQLGESFRVLSANGVEGTFDRVNGVDIDSMRSYAVTYTSSGIDITVAQWGDSDLDLDVDTSDITEAIINFTSVGGEGKIWVNGDYDGDGDVDVVDLTGAIMNFSGAASSSISVSAVPEPDCRALAMLSVVALLLLRLSRPQLHRHFAV